jgi:hypothetical protein
LSRERRPSNVCRSWLEVDFPYIYQSSGADIEIKILLSKHYHRQITYRRTVIAMRSPSQSMRQVSPATNPRGRLPCVVSTFAPILNRPRQTLLRQVLPTNSQKSLAIYDLNMTWSPMSWWRLKMSCRRSKQKKGHGCNRSGRPGREGIGSRLPSMRSLSSWLSARTSGAPRRGPVAGGAA